MLSWIVDSIRAELIAQRHNATGAGIASIAIEEVEEGKEWVITGANYLYWVNYGRRPGAWPPMAAIRAWVQAIGLPSTAAFPIARSIAAKGTPGQPYVVWTEGNALRRKNFVGQVVEDNKARISQEIGKAFSVRVFEKYRKEQYKFSV